MKIGVVATLFAVAVAMLYVMGVSNSRMAAVQTRQAESLRLLDRKIQDADGRNVLRALALREKMKRELALVSKKSDDRDTELSARAATIEQAAKQTNWDLLSLQERMNALIEAKGKEFELSVTQLASEQTMTRKRCDASIAQMKQEFDELLRSSITNFSERDAVAFLDGVQSAFMLRITKKRTIELPDVLPMLFFRKIEQTLQWKAIGVIVKDGGALYPLTAMHVFFPPSLPDGFEFAKIEMQVAGGNGFEEAELLGFSPIHDLACADFKEKHPLETYGSPATLAVGDPLAPGERVMAIGLYNDHATPAYGEINSNDIDELSTFGWNPSLILNAARQVPGFSGGPLFSIIPYKPLELVGINGRARLFNGVIMPYSLSYVDIHALLPRMRTPGKIQYGNIGATFKMSGGILCVDAVMPHGPADGKLSAGDIVLGINDHMVSTESELARWLLLEPPGAKVLLHTHQLKTATDLDVEIVLGPEN